MYHYITLGDVKIYMTGVGILLFLVTCTVSILTYAKRYRLQTKRFLLYLPLYIIFRYLFATYTRWFIEQYTVIPLSIKQFLMYFSPAGYPFHLVGILVGGATIGTHILSGVDTYSQKKKWLDTLLHSLFLASIPLGIFLLLGDNFIGVSTEQGLYVTAIRSDSNLAVYGKVIPLGLFLSVRGLLCHIMLNVYTRKTKKHLGYLGLAIFLCGLCVISIYQQYPRHLVSSVRGIRFDIKQYVLILLMVWNVRKHTQQKNDPPVAPQDEGYKTKEAIHQ